MKFYHGTTTENWRLIQKEGVLWGGYTYHKTRGKEGYRYTYLSPDISVAMEYGDGTLLEVDYRPVGNKKKINGRVMDNYGFDPPPGKYCWQFSVFVSIPLSKVKLMSSG